MANLKDNEENTLQQPTRKFGQSPVSESYRPSTQSFFPPESRKRRAGRKKTNSLPQYELKLVDPTVATPDSTENSTGLNKGKESDTSGLDEDPKIQELIRQVESSAQQIPLQVLLDLTLPEQLAKIPIAKRAYFRACINRELLLRFLRTGESSQVTALLSRVDWDQVSLQPVIAELVDIQKQVATEGISYTLDSAKKVILQHMLVDVIGMQATSELLLEFALSERVEPQQCVELLELIAIYGRTQSAQQAAWHLIKKGLYGGVQQSLGWDVLVDKAVHYFNQTQTLPLDEIVFSLEEVQLLWDKNSTFIVIDQFLLRKFYLLLDRAAALHLTEQQRAWIDYVLRQLSTTEYADQPFVSQTNARYGVLSNENELVVRVEHTIQKLVSHALDSQDGSSILQNLADVLSLLETCKTQLDAAAITAFETQLIQFARHNLWIFKNICRVEKVYAKVLWKLLLEPSAGLLKELVAQYSAQDNTESTPLACIYEDLLAADPGVDPDAQAEAALHFVSSDLKPIFYSDLKKNTRFWQRYGHLPYEDTILFIMGRHVEGELDENEIIDWLEDQKLRWGIEKFCVLAKIIYTQSIIKPERLLTIAYSLVKSVSEDIDIKEKAQLQAVLEAIANFQPQLLVQLYNVCEIGMHEPLITFLQMILARYTASQFIPHVQSNPSDANAQAIAAYIVANYFAQKLNCQEQVVRNLQQISPSGWQNIHACCEVIPWSAGVIHNVLRFAHGDAGDACWCFMLENPLIFNVDFIKVALKEIINGREIILAVKVTAIKALLLNPLLRKVLEIGISAAQFDVTRHNVELINALVACKINGILACAILQHYVGREKIFSKPEQVAALLQQLQVFGPLLLELLKEIATDKRLQKLVIAAVQYDISLRVVLLQEFSGQLLDWVDNLREAGAAEEYTQIVIAVITRLLPEQAPMALV